MNHQPESSRDPDAIRSEIDSTRQRMDDTIDALGERLKGRHLVDEILGFFRSRSNGQGSKLGHKLSQSANTAMHSVIDSVKAHPVPSLMIATGLGWLIYESRRNASRSDRYGEEGVLPYEGVSGASTGDYSGSDYYASPSESGLRERAGEAKERLGEKAAHAKESLQHAASSVAERARHSTEQLRERASQIGSRVQVRARETYDHTRQRVAATAEAHPLELGLACLAIGVIAGLALPTPNKVNELAGPTAERLRRKARESGQDLVERGKHVVQAATQAVKDEAESQGLTPDALRKKAGAVADRAKEAASESAEKEGVLPQSSNQPAGQNQPAAAPSVARSIV